MYTFNTENSIVHKATTNDLWDVGIKKRDTCSSNYTTANGLEFNVFCSASFGSQDGFSPAVTRNGTGTDECALFCSEYRNSGGVIYSHTNTFRVLKPNQNFTTISSSSEANYDVVIVNQPHNLRADRTQAAPTQTSRPQQQRMECR